MTSKYNVDFGKLTALLLPVCLRGGTLQALASVMLSPLGILLGELRGFREDKRYRLEHNGQTCHLRAVLNDRFDPIRRGITITEEADEGGGGVRLHHRVTARFLRAPRREDGCVRVFRRGYGGTDRLGFWINVPGRLLERAPADLVRAVTNVYKLASVRFGINYTD